LLQWAANPEIADVVLRDAGEKAFCAGGMYARCGRVCWPVRGLAPNPDAHAFFSEEYQLDLLIDKDQRPRWTPAALADVSPEGVAGYFTAPWHT